MWVLRKTRPPRKRVLKEDAGIGLHKPTTHELRAQFRLQRVYTGMYTHNSDYEDRGGMYARNCNRGGMYARNCNRGGMFMMKHRENSMSASTSNSALKPEDVWFVDSGASNHMTSHKEWFLELREPERPGYVETRDDTTHPIRHIGNVPYGSRGFSRIWAYPSRIQLPFTTTT